MSMRRFLIALSFCNLWYAPVWKRLIASPPSMQLVMRFLPSRAEYAAAICGVLLCSIAAIAFEYGLRKTPGVWRSLDVIIGIPLIAMSMQLSMAGVEPRDLLRGLIGSHLILCFLSAVALLALVVRFHSWVRRAAAQVLIVLVPFCVYTFAFCAYKIAKPTALADQQASMLPNVSSPRVLWVIFDEWDQRLTFDDRPLGLDLPALDRLRGESFYAQDAQPPADSTMVSMPSIIHGRVVRSIKALDAQTLSLTFADGSTQRFGDPPNLFSDARRAGLNAAIYGWYLPYCRVMGSYLADCWWRGFDTPSTIPASSFSLALIQQLRGQFETGRYSPFGSSLSSQKHTSTFEALLEHAKAAAINPRIQLTLVHFDVPHSPFIYDRATDQMTEKIWRPGYADALALVDKTVGELREQMEKAGVWNSVILMLSADHFYRSSPLVNGVRDKRVPFLVHFPGEKSGLQYAQSFNTILTSGLIEAVLRSEVRDAASAADWLNQNRLNPREVNPH